MKRLKHLLPPDHHSKREERFRALGDDGMQQLIAKCEKLGIPYDFLVVGDIFDSERADYENTLMQAHATPARRLKARQDHSVLKSASAMIAFLKEERAFFDTLGENLERRTAAYR